MNIYLLRRTNETYYDQYSGFVVVANNEDEAIKHSVAAYASCDEWVTAEYIACTLVGKADDRYKEVETILCDYNAG